MIQLISPERHSIIGGTKMRYSYSSLAYWNADYIKQLLLWSAGVDVEANGWPDSQNGSTVFIYPVTIWGRTDAPNFELSVLNNDQAAFEFHPLDDFGVPILTSLFTTEIGNIDMQNATLAFHISLPLAFSWLDPATGLRTFAQGNRTIVAAVGLIEAKCAFYVDIRPPNRPVIDQKSQVVTDRTFHISGSSANVDSGSFVVRVRS